ncbi:VanZ family protein [Paenibacillus silvisoli]|uniref:VanZ family protein n=1 Tax=Paenibacillus silvisoli TaxID=3110539 RepID=UPI0028045BCE|nr:VanZ family protein [Paenibacillus silvisoli]
MKQKQGTNNMFIHVLFVVYVYVIVRIILFKFGSVDITFLWYRLNESLQNPDHIIRQFQTGNLIPFDEISKITHGGMSTHGLINLLGNVAIFIPYGILLGVMLRNKKVSCADVFILSFGLSLLLESAQAVLAIGIFDIDDLILNSTGGLLGFIFLKLFASTIPISRVVGDRP